MSNSIIINKKITITIVQNILPWRSLLLTNSPLHCSIIYIYIYIYIYILVEFYFQTKLIVQAQWQYQRHFAVWKASDRKTIWRIVKKFQTEITAHDVNKGRSDDIRGVRAQQNIETFRLAATQNKTISSWWCSP